MNQQFAVQVTATDAETGTASVAYPAITTLGTGASGSTATTRTTAYSGSQAAGGTAVFRSDATGAGTLQSSGVIYTFGSASITASGAQTVTLTDGAGNTATSTFTPTADATAPSGGTSASALPRRARTRAVRRST